MFLSRVSARMLQAHQDLTDAKLVAEEEAPTGRSCERGPEFLAQHHSL
jgi:hypothetical protein